MFYDVYMQLCKNKNLSPSAAAIQSGINKGTVSVWKKKWEKGIDVDPDQTTIDKLCSFFDVQETDLRGLEHIYPVLMPVAEAKIRMDDALAGIKETPDPKIEGVSPTVQELFDFIDTATDAELNELLRYAQFLMSKR